MSASTFGPGAAADDELADLELGALVRSTTAVADRVIAPLAADLDEGLWSDEVWTALVDLGLMGMTVSEDGGGLGLPYSTYLTCTAAVSRASAVAGLVPALNVLVARSLERFGSSAVAQRYLPGLVAGTDVACWAFTEPATGSDPRAITTRATAVDDHWLVSGEKAFISHSSHATVAVVFAQLDGALTAFIGPTGEGFHALPRERLMAFNGADTGGVLLDGFRATHVLGEVGGGFDVLRAGESEAKLRASAISLGMAERALEVATRYALERTHRGQPIGEKFQSTQWLLAECAAKVFTIRAVVEHAGRAFDRGHGTASSAASTKLMTSRLAREVATDCVQVLGAYGASTDHPAEMLYRQTKVYELVQGVSEINRTIIARGLLREADASHRSA